MSATDKPAAAKLLTPAQKRRQAKAKATPIVDAPAVVEPPVTETGEQSSVVAIENAASKRRSRAAAAAPAEDSTPSIPDLFRKGRTIAQIARDAKVGQDAVRSALDEAGVDYTADKNAKAPGATRPAAAKTPAAPKTWTLLASYNAILAKKAEAGSKRAKVQADLATGQNAGDLVEIIASLASLSEGDAAKLAAGANALNAALSAHYARVS